MIEKGTAEMLGSISGENEKSFEDVSTKKQIYTYMYVRISLQFWHLKLPEAPGIFHWI